MGRNYVTSIYKTEITKNIIEVMAITILLPDETESSDVDPVSPNVVEFPLDVVVDPLKYPVVLDPVVTLPDVDDADEDVDDVLDDADKDVDDTVDVAEVTELEVVLPVVTGISLTIVP